MFTTTLRYRRMIRRDIGRGRRWCLSTIVSTLLIGNPVPGWAKGHGGPTPTCAHNTCRKMPSPAGRGLGFGDDEHSGDDGRNAPAGQANLSQWQMGA
jgi:hypothetical protein